MVKIFGNKGGYITFKALVWILIISSALYSAYKFAPPYFGYLMLKTEVEDEAKNAHMYTDRALERRIFQKASVWSVPIDEQNLEIVRNTSYINISVHYTVDLNFFDRYHKELKYRIEVQEPLKDPARVLH